MKALVKCSHCGSEISNLTMSWRRSYWLITLVILLFCLIPLAMILWPEGDFRSDLKLTHVKHHVLVGSNQLEVIGTIENQGKSAWKFIEVEAEFFDADGTFIGEISGTVSKNLGPGEKDHFKITDGPSMLFDVLNSRLVAKKKVTMKAKIADARSDRF
ncbi:MAG: hypothetical protein JW818_00165 [Pirellulales bacterium]|nr:hypothetical protein [Pirellulales bacterium]